MRKLTSLDVSANIVLERLYRIGNQLSDKDLNELFATFPRPLD